MSINQLKIVGCGGHSKVVLDALSLMGKDFDISLCDSNPALLGTKLNGYLVDSLPQSLTSFSGFIHVAIGNNLSREKLISLVSADALLFNIIHPKAIISLSARIGKGVFVAAGSILAPESSIGDGCIINHGAIIDHEVNIGNYTHIAPNATLGGNVVVGNRVLIGAGAVILPGVTIGDDAIIGAGAVVINDIESNALVKGVPAV